MTLFYMIMQKDIHEHFRLIETPENLIIYFASYFKGFAYFEMKSDFKRTTIGKNIGIAMHAHLKIFSSTLAGDLVRYAVRNSWRANFF